MRAPASRAESCADCGAALRGEPALLPGVRGEKWAAAGGGRGPRRRAEGARTRRETEASGDPVAPADPRRRRQRGRFREGRAVELHALAAGRRDRGDGAARGRRRARLGHQPARPGRRGGVDHPRRMGGPEPRKTKPKNRWRKRPAPIAETPGFDRGARSAPGGAARRRRAGSRSRPPAPNRSRRNSPKKKNRCRKSSTSS